MVITFTGNRSIVFVYDASGAKLRKYVINGTTKDSFDYVNGVEYKNMVLQRLAHTEGSVSRNEFGAYDHEYILRDHLGNARVTFKDGTNKGDPYIDWSTWTYVEPNAGNTGYNDGVITQDDIKTINNYYPFGMDMEGNWNGSFDVANNKYKYNEKEWNNDFGLGLYDYGFRWYDPSIGRFPSVDPVCNKFTHVTPYNYAENRPSSGVDLWGLQYLSGNVKFQLDQKNKTMDVSGKLDVIIKIVNLSSSSPTSSALSYHSGKASTTFDNINQLTYNTVIPFSPIDGKNLGKGYNIKAKLNIDFKFDNKIEKKLDALKKGDVALLLVDKLKDPDHPGIASKGGHVYAIEVAEFNKMYHIGTHELGHLLGDLLDVKGKNAPQGYLMSYGDGGNGYKLTTGESREVIDEIMYIMGYKKKQGEHDTQSDAKDLYQKEVKH